MTKKGVPVRTSYQEIQVGNTVYRVTSVYPGEREMGKALERLAIRRAMVDRPARTAR